MTCKRLILGGMLLSLLPCGGQALLLSDVATPALVIDVGSLRKTLGDVDMIPPLALSSKTRQCLVPVPLDGDVATECPHHFATTDAMFKDETIWNQVGLCYWHTSVQRGRAQVQSTDDLAVFLAQLDVPSRIVRNERDAYLCLGLNNHHVISYYWARSAGSGAAMEAPGIVLHPNGYLYWQSPNGPTACNTNDGKRSEWANFLKPGDQVQLVPHHPDEAFLEWLKEKDDGANRIYGISSCERPLGSEPAVVCEWKLQEKA